MPENGTIDICPENNNRTSFFPLFEMMSGEEWVQLLKYLLEKKSSL